MLIRAFICVAIFFLAEIPSAQTSTPSPSATPSLEQRVADLEAYINNSARGADVSNAQTVSNIPGPVPDHNAWMLTCAAVVLLMPLPGLALFYVDLGRP